MVEAAWWKVAWRTPTKWIDFAKKSFIIKSLQYAAEAYIFSIRWG